MSLDLWLHLNPWRGVQQGPCLLYWPFHRSEFWIEKICKEKKGTSNKERKDIYHMQTVLLKLKWSTQNCWQIESVDHIPKDDDGQTRYDSGGDIRSGLWSGRRRRRQRWRKTLWKLGKWNIRFYLPERLGPFRWFNHLLKDVNKNSIFLLTLYHWQSQSWLWCWIVKNL